MVHNTTTVAGFAAGLHEHRHIIPRQEPFAKLLVSLLRGKEHFPLAGLIGGHRVRE